nr:hypothetical protein [Myxococcota bacterium]
MARVDKSQTGARQGIAKIVDGVRAAPTNDVNPRSRVGLETVAELDARGDAKQKKSASAANGSGKPRARIDAGDRSAFDGRATNVAAREPGARGQRTARGTVDQSGEKRASERKPSRARGVVGAVKGAVKDFFFGRKEKKARRQSSAPEASNASAKKAAGAGARSSNASAKEKSASKTARGDGERAREGVRGGAEIRDAASRGREPRRAAQATKSAPGLGTTTRPVRAGEG